MSTNSLLTQIMAAAAGRCLLIGAQAEITESYLMMQPNDIRPTEPIETRRSIYWHGREPRNPCQHCGHPYGLHRGDCQGLTTNTVDVCESRTLLWRPQ